MTRWDRLASGLASNACSAALLVGSDHACHLAGYTRLYSGPVALIIDQDGKRTLLVPTYEVDVAREHADVEAVAGFGGSHFGIDPRPHAALAVEVARLLPRGRIGLVDDASSAGGTALATARRDSVPLAGLISALRLVKDHDEHELLARSFALALDAQDTVQAEARVGAREIDLYSAAQSAAQRAAGAPIEFSGDLLTGIRTSLVCGPVAVAGATEVAPGDAIVSDLSVRHRGYWGDTARTHLVSAPDEVFAVRDTVGAILEETVALLRPGMVAADVFAFMCDAIVGRCPGARFPHHAGHGIGVTALEDPHLIPADRTPLQAGMVLALEPGAYFDDLGIRIENVYLVTDAGGVQLGGPR